MKRSPAESESINIMTYYLAVDIGASSGRHILAHMENGKLLLEEIYRFENRFETSNGHKVWNTEKLFAEILEGLRKCRECGKIPVSMGIDTWAVDYVLLDSGDRMIGPCYAYRDGRTEGMEEEVYRLVPEDLLYRKTGIQRASFNTVFQLMADLKQMPERLEQAETFLMVPDYLQFLLTGIKKQEYTNASTTGLLAAAQYDWDRELIRQLHYPERLFKPLSLPGTEAGMLRPEIAAELGFDLKVILPATHDTASAVMSVPFRKGENALYLSSGTWSLLGCEMAVPDTGKQAQHANFTNEGGYDHRFRFLKNIMGLWMIQSVQRELQEGYAADASGRFRTDPADTDYSFGHLCRRAADEKTGTTVDADDARFLAPASMIREIRLAAEESGQEIPETPWELARVVYHSLAVCYKKAVQQLSEITGRHFDTIHIVGGGCKAAYLNRLTAEETGLTVTAGPSEATAAGNIGAQILADHAAGTLEDFRKLVYDSFSVETYRKEQ